MQINIKRIDEAYLMEASNEDGHIINIDGSTAIGAAGNAMRPMQLMLVGIGGCSAIDVITFLKKQRQELRDIRMEVTAEREEGRVPSLFTTIHVKFYLYGDLSISKVERALSLSMEKYCSVAKILEKTATITYSYTIEE